MKRTGEIMARLKHATRTRHETVERLIDLDRLSASPAHYRHWLQRLYGFYTPLEVRLARLPWSTAGLDFDARRKSGLLAQDLAALAGCDHARACLCCPPLPSLTTLAHGFGCLYVLEGATLGGRIIARRLSARLAIDERRGGQFYHCYGARGGAMWQRFCRAVDAYALAHPDAERMILDAACDTFECFEQWLSGWADPDYLKA